MKVHPGIKEDLEVKLFGGILPKVKITRKPVRTGKSERDRGRGGRNEKAEDVMQHDWLAMGAVDFMLDRKKNKVRDEDEVIKKLPLKVGSLFRKRKSRKKTITINFDDLSDDEDKDYIPNIRTNRLLDRRNTRKSRRLQETQSRCNVGEYKKELQIVGQGDDEYVSSNEEGALLTNCDMSDIGKQEDERFVVENIEIVNNNYLRSLKDSSKCLEFEKVIETNKAKNLASLELTRELRMRAERTLGKKYKGYGYKALPEAESEVRWKKRSCQEDTESRKNKEELDLDLEELLKCVEEGALKHDVAEQGWLLP